MKVRLGTFDIGLGRYIGLWTVVAVVFAIQRSIHDDLDNHAFDTLTYLRWSLIQWYSWAVLAPLVFRLAARYRFDPAHRLRGIGIHALASMGVTLLSMVIGAVVSTFFEPSGLGEQLHQFTRHMGTGLFTYWALLAIQQSVQLHEEKTRRDIEASRLASELAQSRLHALKSQLQPHFLFNTLHAIATLLREDAVSAEDMLIRLSDLLRAFLEDQDGQEITLRKELVLLDLYLGIQQMRFKDRLSTRIYVQPDTLECAVPSLILQPIVENAIRYGIGEQVGDDRVDVEARREGDTLRIEVRNRNSTLARTGPEASAPGHGIGLRNTALRLRELYGDEAGLRLDMIWPQGVVCRIHLPCREVDEPDDTPEIIPA